MRIVSIREHPEYKDIAISYFQKAWPFLDPIIYDDAIRYSINARDTLPQWYLLEKDDVIIGCAGLITNDFISRFHNNTNTIFMKFIFIFITN